MGQCMSSEGIAGRHSWALSAPAVKRALVDVSGHGHHRARQRHFTDSSSGDAERFARLLRQNIYEAADMRRALNV